jgi:septum formation inhibitor-activating ATPase MinD
VNDPAQLRFCFLIGRGCFQAKGLADRMSVTMNPEVQYVTNADGKRTAVMLSLDRYKRLLEDVHDLGVIVERIREEPINLEEMKERLIT